MHYLPVLFNKNQYIDEITLIIEEIKKLSLKYRGEKTDGGRKIQTRYIKTRKNTTIAKLYNKHSKKTKKYRK
jgi:predicted enzyme involved in methoxymalonyl-ACP biosynthesis